MGWEIAAWDGGHFVVSDSHESVFSASGSWPLRVAASTVVERAIWTRHADVSSPCGAGRSHHERAPGGALGRDCEATASTGCALHSFKVTSFLVGDLNVEHDTLHFRACSSNLSQL
jgi:hypothetical protein